MRRAFRIAIDAFWRFNADDGWAIASHIALSALMAMFPFFIVLTSLAGTFGSSDLAEKVAHLMLATWPEEVARPIARRNSQRAEAAPRRGHTGPHPRDLFRLERDREPAHRPQPRLWRGRDALLALLRLESIGYVVLGAAAMLALGFLIVLGPLLFRTALRHAPWLEPLEGTFTFFRFAHRHRRARSSRSWLRTNGCRPAAAGWIEILPGIVATLVLWLVAGIAFGRYLAEYSGTYVSLLCRASPRR